MEKLGLLPNWKFILLQFFSWNNQLVHFPLFYWKLGNSVNRTLSAWIRFSVGWDPTPTSSLTILLDPPLWSRFDQDNSYYYMDSVVRKESEHRPVLWCCRSSGSRQGCYATVDSMCLLSWPMFLIRATSHPSHILSTPFLESIVADGSW